MTLSRRFSTPTWQTTDKTHSESHTCLSRPVSVDTVTHAACGVSGRDCPDGTNCLIDGPHDGPDRRGLGRNECTCEAASHNHGLLSGYPSTTPYTCSSFCRSVKLEVNLPGLSVCRPRHGLPFTCRRHAPSRPTSLLGSQPFQTRRILFRGLGCGIRLLGLVLLLLCCVFHTKCLFAFTRIP